MIAAGDGYAGGDFCSGLMFGMHGSRLLFGILRIAADLSDEMMSRFVHVWQYTSA